MSPNPSIERTLGPMHHMDEFNTLDEQTVAQAGTEVVKAAIALTSHAVPFIQGVRMLRGLSFSASNVDHDPDFMLFIAIDSESDHFPPLEVRAMCSDSWLTECDQEASRLESFYESEVKAACVRLIERFSGEA